LGDIVTLHKRRFPEGRIVYGHVGIGPFADNGTVHINLDGVEMIAGTLGVDHFGSVVSNFDCIDYLQR
jgi:hypothetical protein